jgi:hypothetical protein
VGFQVDTCRVVNRAFPPKLHVAVRLLGSERISSISHLRAFELVCALSARVTRRRQVNAIATRPTLT